jgi:type IV secretory pathway VirD2 relaxase
MRHIIESGNERAKRGMEIQIYNLGGDYDWESAHHADVTEEAVKWIERECIVWRKEAN